MKKLLLALALCLLPTVASAQCSGVFTDGTVCGNATGGSTTPRMTPYNSFVPYMNLTQYHFFIGNASGKAADTAMGGDCTYTTSYGIICTKTNNVAFGPFATATDMNTQISHFNSGTGASSTTYWRGDGTWGTVATGLNGDGATTPITSCTSGYYLYDSSGFLACQSPAQLLAALGTASTQPVVANYVNGRYLLTPPAGATYVSVAMIGGGGGGGGNSTINTFTQGSRGVDSAFHSSDHSVTVTSGACTVITYDSTTYGAVKNSQPMWFTATSFPNGISAGTATTGTVYYVLNGSQAGSGASATFQLASNPYTPLVGFTQTCVNTISNGSGVIAHIYDHVASAGGPGVGPGDQGAFIAPLRCDSTGLTTFSGSGWNGGQGGGGPGAATTGNIPNGGYGGNGFYGGGGAAGEQINGTPGSDGTGGGGAGAGGGSGFAGAAGGASGSYCEITYKITESTYALQVGAGGAGGGSGGGYAGGSGAYGSAKVVWRFGPM